MDDNRELQRRYLTIFKSKIIGIISTNSNGEFIDGNDCFLEMLGYSRADLDQRLLNWKMLTPPELMQESLEIQQKLLANPGTSISFEKEYLHKDGHRVPVLIGVTSFRDGTDIAVVHDISARRKIENELAAVNQTLESRVDTRTQQLGQSEAFLSGIIETMPSMVFVKDAENLKFVRLNRAGEKLLGISREEFVGKTDYDFFSKDLADHFRSIDRRVLNGEIPHAITQDELPTKNGIRLIHTVKIPIRDKSGHAQYLLGVTEDITERLELDRQRDALVRAQAEKESAENRAQQERFVSELTFELSQSIDLKDMLRKFSAKVIPVLADICTIEIIDEEGMDYLITEVRGIDKEEEDFVRRWRTENLPKWDSEFGGPTIIRSGKTLVVNGMDTIEKHVGENYGAEIDLNGGRVLSKSFMIVPMMARNRKPLGFVSYVSSKSQRKYHERDQTLAEEISSRLAVMIENSRLYDRAQDASRAKSDFLANVSHEIRTPLGAMLGFADILKDEANLSEEQKHSVDTILRNGHQLLKIVNEILDISKIESEKIQIENIPFGVRELLEDVVHLLKAQAEEKNIELRLKMGTVRDQMISDSGRIRQILINMVGNAIKFTERGHVELKADAIPNGPPGRFILQFTVKDTGIGISKEQRAHLFQPFSQADGSTTRRFGGTGLGLFLSRKLARLLGGDITFQSFPGKGSDFTVTVIAHAISQLGLGESHRPGTQAPSSSEALTRVGKILVVDDAPDNRELFKRYLQKAGIATPDIELAENGEEALKKAGATAYRLILMDIQMPKMDGFQTLHELRARGYKGTVIALTAHAMKGDREKCLEAGFDGYLQKPLKREALQEVLNQEF